MSSIRPGPATPNIYKINESTSGYSASSEHTSDHIFRRYPSYGGFSGSHINGQGHNIIFNGTLGFCDKYGKICPRTLPLYRILGDENLPNHKATTLRSPCEQTLISKQVTLRDLSKLIGKLRATAPAITPAHLQIRYLQQCQIRNQKTKLSYETLVSRDQNCILELKWWIENINLTKGKPLSIQSPFPDAVKSGGWGQHQQAYPQEGCGQQRRENCISILWN